MPRTAKKPTASTSVGGSGQSAAPVVPARVQPITVPTGLPYGEAGALADAQKQLPLPGGDPVVTAPANAPQQPSPAPATPPPNIQSALAAATADTSPPIGLAHPPRPGEVPSPALMLPPNGPPDNVAALINQLAPNSSDLQYLAAFVNAGRR